MRTNDYEWLNANIAAINLYANNESRHAVSDFTDRPKI